VRIQGFCVGRASRRTGELHGNVGYRRPGQSLGERPDLPDTWRYGQSRLKSVYVICGVVLVYAYIVGCVRSPCSGVQFQVSR
jgi:hypothetical protein